MNDVLFYVVSFLLQFAAFLFVARFLLQVCRVDFYNPISQGIVKATDLVLKPVRMVLPGYGNIDFAALIAALAANVLLIVAASAITDQYVGSVIQILTAGVLAVIGQYPDVAARVLAEHLACDRDWLKPNVRKLKNLGLTVSHHPGYTLSPRGETMLRHLPREA